jgi:hypothetical protein
MTAQAYALERSRPLPVEWLQQFVEVPHGTLLNEGDSVRRKNCIYHEGREDHEVYK